MKSSTFDFYDKVRNELSEILIKARVDDAIQEQMLSFLLQAQINVLRRIFDGREKDEDATS